MSKTPHPGNVYAQLIHNIQDARARYPKQFSQPMLSCAWPDGWNNLIFGVFSHVHDVGVDLQWAQIKEKFGGLSMYYKTDPKLDPQTPSIIIPDSPPVATLDIVDLVIVETERRSYITCSKCGNAGRVLKFFGWWLPACETCQPLIQQHHQKQFGGEDT